MTTARTKRRLLALSGVLVLVAYLGTNSTISAYLARLVNTTDTVSSAPPDCHYVPLSDGATRLYPLNETTGTTAIDESSSAQNGTYQGGRQTVNASPYACVRNLEAYPRVDQTHWVSTPGTISISPTTSSSQEAWVRTVNSQGVAVAIGSTQTAASPSKNLLVLVNSTGRLVFAVQGSGVTYELVSGYSINDGSWHHVVAVHDASYGLKLYLDNTLAASQSGVHPTALTGYLRIGYENTNGFTNGFGTDQSAAHWWDHLAFISYYPFALTATQVNSHYQAGR
ncbi:LamG domain-containing protein [Actinokineospora auranticolor]|uniref:Concanavalin A-like lectin/glucanase superfamily protein n=1 Tax=Actinokineospora auranticolor TaxID=155976 RepID=A0A2S6GCJ8_9PSEU|nr:LamG-like jellyroll fold domain-containing protein [Actinokineospora auranticolor]PPK62573.1 concanavalin A-like lectin/glucanase superfamily protein [Actinokineospora auranticolor]